MRRLTLTALLTAPPSAWTCPPTLDFALRPLGGKEAVQLCERYAGEELL